MQKKWLIIMITAAILLATLVVVLLLFILPSEENALPTETIPAETLPPLSTEKIKSSLDTALSVLEEGSENDPAFLRSVDEKNGYEVLSFEQTESETTAIVKVFSPDLYSIAKKLDSDGITRTEEELSQAILSEIATAPLIESQIEIELTLTEDGYIPVLTSEFLDALYGGVFRLYDDMLTSS